MKVLLCVGRYYMGGIEKYATDLALKLNEMQINVTLLVFFKIETSQVEVLRARGIDVVELGGGNGRDLKMIFLFIKILRRVKPDIVHLNILPLLTFIPLLFYEGKVVYTIHQMTYIKHFDFLFKNVIDGVIAVSHKVEQYFHKKAFLKNSNWITIHNGVRGNDSVTCKEPDEIIKLIMVSRLAQDKQPDHAIEILKYLRDNSGKKYHLTFVGKGDVNDEGYIKSIKNTIMTEDLNEYVSFVGWQENVFPFLTEANGFLMLSRKESFGYNVVEAMSVGLPIFSYDVEGGLIELHQNLVTGIMVNDNSPITLASKIDEVFDDLNLWREFSCKAKQKSKSFSIENMTSKTLDFYVEINKIK